MKYLSFRTRTGHESVGALVGDRVMDVGSRLPIETAGLSRMRRLLLAHDGHLPVARRPARAAAASTVEEIQLLPVVPDPTKIVAAPVNYLDHKAEMNEDSTSTRSASSSRRRRRSSRTGETVRLPYTDRRFDQEGELALVIGRTARNVAVADAVDHIAGYTCLLDMTMRGGEDRSTRKSFDTFTPVGPLPGHPGRGRTARRAAGCRPGSTMSCARTPTSRTSSGASLPSWPTPPP